MNDTVFELSFKTPKETKLFEYLGRQRTLEFFDALIRQIKVVESWLFIYFSLCWKYGRGSVLWCTFSSWAFIFMAISLGRVVKHSSLAGRVEQ